MNAKVFPIIIVAAFLCLAIVPFAMQAQSSHHSQTESNLSARAASTREVIRQLQATDE